MTISIVLPKPGGLRTGHGTRVFNEDGVEIKEVTRIDMVIESDCIVTAKIDVAINTIEDMDNIHALLGTETLEQIAKIHGCEFIPFN